MFGLKDAKTKVASLEARSESVFNVLNAHYVFGALEKTQLEVERRGFKDAIIEHALGDNEYRHLTLTYPSGVRLIITTTVFAGIAMFANVTASAHSQNNDQIRYDSLNREIMDALNDLSGW